MQEIIIKWLRTIPSGDPEKEIEWLIKSLGFVSPRDKAETALKIFNSIINGMRQHRPCSSEQIARDCNISRAAALHHIKNFLSAGMVINENRAYTLRMQSLTRTIEEMEYDAMRTFARLKEIARQVDKQLGMH